MFRGKRDAPVAGRDVRFGRGGTVSFESFPSEFGQKSSKFCSHSVGIHSFGVFQMMEKNHEKRTVENEIRQKSRNLTSSQHCLRNFAKFR